MKIGMTFDLRDVYLAEGLSDAETAEFDRVDTVDALESELRSWGHDPDRIGRVTDLMARLLAGERWDLVFNIAEGLRGIGREAQVPALLDAYGIPYTFSDPLVMALSLHKGMTKRVLRGLGIPTPDFVVIEDLGDLRELALPYPVFVKPVAEGTGKGITAGSKIGDPSELFRRCAELLRDFRQGVLVETFLPGREFTVGLVGTGRSARCVGLMEVILKDNADRAGYTYANKENYEERVIYRRVDDAAARAAAAIALRAYLGLGCRDAGRVDLRVDLNGVPNFIEINPLAGLHPKHSDLPILCTLNGITYHDLIGEILASATARTEPHRQVRDHPTAPSAVAIAALGKRDAWLQ